MIEFTLARSRTIRQLTVMMAALWGTLGYAADATIESEQAKLIRAPMAVGTLGPTLFGDKVNIYNGALEFAQTDVSLPGNSKLPVAAGRRLITGGKGNEGQGLFAHWDLDIPRIYGMFATDNGWRRLDANNVASTARCTNFGAPPPFTRYDTTHKFRAIEFWHGNMLYVPGEGEQEILRRDAQNTNIPSDSIATPLVTKGLWAIRCLPSLASTTGTTIANEAGEGFLAIAPDGTQYRFDWLVSRPAESITKPISFSPTGPALSTTTATLSTDAMTAAVSTDSVANGATADKDSKLPKDPKDPKDPGKKVPRFPSPMGEGVQMLTMGRTEVSIFPTLVTDRYGNTVRYTYDTTDKWKVLTIASADGAGNNERKLTFTYVANSHRVQTVTDGTRTWTYTYAVGPSNVTMLTRVTQPDNSAWDFNGMDAGSNTGMIRMELVYAPPLEGAGTECHAQPPDISSPAVTGTMVHPSGAIGSFTMTPTQHARNGVPTLCYTDNATAPSRPYQSMYYDMYSITRKQISGAGLATMNWDTSYDTFNPGHPQCLTCMNTVSVSDPKGDVSRFVFGSTYGVNEGMLQQSDIGYSGGALRSTALRYNYSFLDLIGSSDQVRGDSKINERHIPQDRRVITQQGVDFTWLVPANADFDKYRRPTRVVKSSSLGHTRTEATTYHNNTVKWILGQIERIDVGNKVPVANAYNNTTSNLEGVSYFGRPDATMTYNSDGTLATKKDSLSQGTTFASYKRGIPRTTTYHNGTSETLAVNDIGKITSRTDQNGIATAFGYDAMGRVNLITPPAATAGEPQVWNPTSVAFQQVPSAELTLSGPHWRQTISTGNARTITYFDAMLRPVYVNKFEQGAIASTSSIVRNDYDFNGNVTFASYPQRDFASIASGVYQEYDALGRKTTTGTQSELGMIWSGNSYGSGFTTTATNGRGMNTAFTYQVFDEPTENAIATITAPAGVNVAIARDTFGKPQSITRSGGGKSAVRSYAYDANDRLCKTIEPESGATVQAYDGANNVAWRASGLALPATGSCDQASVAATRKITYSYDGLNRLLNTTFGDASPSITRTYTPDGLPLTVNSNGSNWTYAYNRKRLNTSESLVFGGTTYALRKTYDANGFTKLLTYPDNVSVDYAPNALGMPTAAGTFATAVQYHPNGAIKGFTYGNGVAHTLTQNLRGLPERSTDAGVLSDVYAFDQNGNVTSITDTQESISTRSMYYDDLDRLTLGRAPAMWGDAWYGYDALDNITTSALTAGAGLRTMTHNTDAASNRLSSVTGTAAFAFTYGYDVQGNITQRGSQAYVFDIGNRMKQATGKATYGYDGWGRRTSVVGTDGLTRLQMYSQDGKIVYSGPTTSTKTKYIYLHNHVVAEVGGAGTEYLHTDGLGSPVARTSTAKTLISRTRYEPYGRTAMGAQPTIGFTGHVNDIDTGLTYMQQRYYDPVAGRMMSIDPVTADANTGGSFNRYTYAYNSPYRYLDPDGRDPMDWVHGGLTVASFCPSVCGSAFSAIDGGILYAQGDRVGASIAFGAAVVGIVSDAGAVKVAGMAAREVASSASAAVKFEKALASEAQTAKILAGKGEVIAGAGTKAELKQADRLAREVGGKAEDWTKVSGGSHVAKDGTKIETHAFENKKIDSITQMKTKLIDEGK